MKDDMQFGAQGDDQLQNRKSSTDFPWLMKNSSSDEEDEGRRKKTEVRRKKTGSVMQVEPDTGQTAYTPRWQKTGSAMQVESRDPRSYPIQTVYIPTGSNVQVEPTDVQVHPGQTARLPTGSGMQIESLDQRSHLIQTACTPPSLATQQPEEDGLTALLSLQLKPTYTPDDDSARPAGHAVAQQMEEEMAVEKELSTLQLTPEMGLQSPTSRQQECRIKTEAVIEQEPRGKSSALEVSDQEQLTANKPEIAE